jgi:hypothetical protein
MAAGIGRANFTALRLACSARWVICEMEPRDVGVPSKNRRGASAPPARSAARMTKAVSGWFDVAIKNSNTGPAAPEPRTAILRAPCSPIPKAVGSRAAASNGRLHRLWPVAANAPLLQLGRLESCEWQAASTKRCRNRFPDVVSRLEDRGIRAWRKWCDDWLPSQWRRRSCSPALSPRRPRNGIEPHLRARQATLGPFR